MVERGGALEAPLQEKVPYDMITKDKEEGSSLDHLGNPRPESQLCCLTAPVLTANFLVPKRLSKILKL